MILKSTRFGKQKTIYNDLRSAEKDLNPKCPKNSYSYQITELQNFKDFNYHVSKYVVNPYLLSCSCDFHENIAEDYSNYDLRKVCFHLYTFFQRKSFKGLKQITKILLADQYKFGIHCLHKVDESIYLSWKPRSKWMKIYLEDNLSWLRYSYNLDDERWSYNRSPENAEKYSKMITELEPKIIED